MHLQDMIMTLERFWAAQGCVLAQPYDVEKGAGTMNPATFFRALGPEPWRVAYVEPSRRPVDGRYGENPFRTFQHWQYQVVLKPSPDDAVDIYLDSLRTLGIDLEQHDLRLLEDNWEAPTLGAAGRGWEVRLDGMEITQFTYFQQMGGTEARPVAAEITYGLERLAMYLQDRTSMFDITWAPGITYGELFLGNEQQQSRYGFEEADTSLLFNLFDLHETEGTRLLEGGMVLPAYEQALKCSHIFNLLDARGAISVTLRAGYINRIRALSVRCARIYLADREEQGFPLLADAGDKGADAS